jgi:hypothetical protein
MLTQIEIKTIKAIKNKIAAKIKISSNHNRIILEQCYYDLIQFENQLKFYNSKN